MYKRRINVRGIIYQNGKIFAQKLKKKDGENPFWSTPGGGLDDGERLQDGLHREMIEETGVKPEIGKLLFVQQFEDDRGENIEFFFHIKNTKDYENIDLNATTHGNEEVSQSGFIDLKSQEVLPEDIKGLDLEKLTTESGAIEVASYL